MSNVRVQSGKAAKLIVGSQVPVLGAVQVSNGTTTQSVDYKPSGIILNVTPMVRAGSVDLQIDQQISNFEVTTTGVNTSPTLITRELSTSVGVHGSEVLVLGGLNDEQKTNTSSGLPFLPSWLKSKTDNGNKTEIVMVLQVDRI